MIRSSRDILEIRGRLVACFLLFAFGCVEAAMGAWMA